jgi:hypothetical protein
MITKTKLMRDADAETKLNRCKQKATDAEKQKQMH